MTTESHTPRTDLLWVELMAACKISGIAPARCEAFASLDKFRALERENADLLAALKALVAANPFYLSMTRDEAAAENAAMKQARAAIAKAEPQLK